MKNLLKDTRALKNVYVVLLIVGLLFLAFGGLEWLTSSKKGTPNPGNIIYSGRITLDMMFVKYVDGSTYALEDADCEQWRCIHGSKVYSDKVGALSWSGNKLEIAGEMSAADSGVWYLIWDPGTNTTAWLDIAETLKSTYVQSIFGEDGDIDGFQEVYVKLYLGGLEALKAGESTKVVDLRVVGSPARRASIDFVNLVNASWTGASYAYESATGYTTGFTEGDLAYIAKIQLDFSNTGNSTYPDTDQWMLYHLKLGPYTWTAANFGSYDLSNTRYEIKFGDQVNFVSGGKPLYYAKNAGTLWGEYELKAYCGFAATAVIVPKILIYLYDPDGTMTTAFTEYVMYTRSS